MEPIANIRKPEFIFIFTAIRGLSTTFVRSFLDNPDVDIYWGGKLFQIYMTEVVANKTKLSAEVLTEDLEAKLEESYRKNRTIIFKDLSYSADVFFVDVIKRWKKMFNIKFLFLVRHPKAQYASYQKCLAIERELKRFPYEDLEAMAQFDYYQSLWNLYSTFGGKVVISEDLQADPASVMKEAFEYAGLSFDESFLTYPTLAERGIPDALTFWRPWYTDCINSTCIKKGVTDISAVIIDPKDVDRVTSSEGYYKLFVEVRYLQLQWESFLLALPFHDDVNDRIMEKVKSIRGLYSSGEL